jgi:hypothetical protein
MTAPVNPELTRQDYRACRDLANAIAPTEACLRNPEGLPLDQLLARDGSFAAPVIAARVARQKAQS